jgi:dihydroflavonol-4-reductase
MVRALVTGGTGFVGAHVARALAQAGHEVRVLHRRTSRLTALDGVPFESAFGDVTDAGAVRAACEGVEHVFHVAAVADYWRADPGHMVAVNVDGTRHVLAAARQAGVKRVIFTSSAAALGMRPDGRPASEADRFNLPPARFPYGYSKALAEEHALEAAAAGQEVVIVNPVVILGPGDINRISGEFVIRIRRSGRWLPVPPGGVAVTDVRDVARWHLAAAERGVSGERYILGSENFAYRDWFALIAEIVGRARPVFSIPHFALPPLAAALDALRAAGLRLPLDGNQTRLSGRQILFDFSKTWAALGAPQVPMRQSVADTYDWYRAHGMV